MIMNRLEQYIVDNGLKTAKIISSDLPTDTVDQAAVAFNCSPDDIAKSIVVVTESGDHHLVILLGSRRLKIRKLKRFLQVQDVRLASPDQVRAVTGYDVGDLPPVSVDLPVIVDERVLEREKVYTGGGAPNTLLHVSIEEMVACTNPIIADVSVKRKG
ncbi:MAG: aminoacyl-tRNA deacylase [Candidatus Hodarchaeales archaeon]|jgi:prolyl-tRNA editing enzyme YbaK/EbsC (Cys-tRNA(Pro) deacylase)